MTQVAVEESAQRWYQAYMGEFVALARGEAHDVRRLMNYWGVPLLLSNDAKTTVLADEAQVLAAAQRMIDDARADNYGRGEVVAAQTTTLNRSSVLHRIEAVRIRSDGTESFRGTVSYLITDLPEGRRISAIVIDGTL